MRVTGHRDARRAGALALAALLALAAAGPARAQTQAPRRHIEEVRDGRRVAILVSRAYIVDARDPARAAFDHYRKALAGEPPRPHPAGHRAVARQLNKYITKHRSITAVETVEEADFVIVFNVLRTRRSFVPDEPYVYGQLFVIARPPGQPPRVVWESEDNNMGVDDAVEEFLDAFKVARGEK